MLSVPLVIVLLVGSTECIILMVGQEPISEKNNIVSGLRMGFLCKFNNFVYRGRTPGVNKDYHKLLDSLAMGTELSQIRYGDFADTKF